MISRFNVELVENGFLLTVSRMKKEEVAPFEDDYVEEMYVFEKPTKLNKAMKQLVEDMAANDKEAK